VNRVSKVHLPIGRGIVLAVLAFLCATGGGRAVFARSSLPLKGSIAEDNAADSAIPAVKPVVTSLEVNPQLAEEPLQPSRRRVDAVDAYAPVGIGSSVLRLYPTVEVGGVYSSNANGSATRPKEAVGLRFKPSLRLESDWVRHSLTGGLEGDITHYAELEDVDTASLNIFQRLRLDVRQQTTAEIETRYTLDQPGGEDPAEHTLSGSAALTQDFGPMALKLTGGLRKKYYEDSTLANGKVEDNADRDYTEPSAAIRATFNQYGVIRPFTEASVAPRIHDRAVDRFGLERDSVGIGLTTGLQIESGPIWTGEVGLTYLHRNYQAAELGSADALGLAGSVTWSPTELTRIVMAAGTALDEVESASTGARPTWTASVNATYALRDNIDLLSGAAVEIEGAGGERTYDGNVGLAWKFNPSLAWTASYDLTWLDSPKSGGDYVEHRITTGLALSR
jgi:hypothetical protein